MNTSKLRLVLSDILQTRTTLNQIITIMAVTKDGEPIPCGGCPGGQFCSIIDEDQEITTWETSANGQPFYWYEFTDRNGMATAPGIITRDKDQQFIAADSITISEAQVHHADRTVIKDQEVESALQKVGRLCIQRMKNCPGPRADSRYSPPLTTCSAGLGQMSVEFVLYQLANQGSRISKDNA